MNKRDWWTFSSPISPHWFPLLSYLKYKKSEWWAPHLSTSHRCPSKGKQPSVSEIPISSSLQKRLLIHEHPGIQKEESQTNVLGQCYSLCGSQRAMSATTINKRGTLLYALCATPPYIIILNFNIKYTAITCYISTAHVGLYLFTTTESCLSRVNERISFSGPSRRESWFWQWETAG